MSASNGPRTVVALREHIALVRALLEEIDRIVPAAARSGHEEAIGRQFIEELTRLGGRIRECATVMAQAVELPAASDSDSTRHPFAQRPATASSSRFKAGGAR
jgi:hypothetical protein